jgi:hypothetical protein
MPSDRFADAEGLSGGVIPCVYVTALRRREKHGMPFEHCCRMGGSFLPSPHSTPATVRRRTLAASAVRAATGRRRTQVLHCGLARSERATRVHTAVAAAAPGGGKKVPKPAAATRGRSDFYAREIKLGGTP